MKKNKNSKALKRYTENIENSRGLFYTILKVFDENILTPLRQISAFLKTLYFSLIAHRFLTGTLTFGLAGVGAVIYITVDVRKQKRLLELRSYDEHQKRMAEANHVLTPDEFAAQLKAFAEDEVKKTLKQVDEVLKAAQHWSDIEKEAYINKRLQEALNGWLKTNYAGLDLHVYRNKTYVLPAERGVNPNGKIKTHLQALSDRMFGKDKYEVDFKPKDKNGKVKFNFNYREDWKENFLAKKRNQQEFIKKLPLWVRFFRFTSLDEIIGDETPEADLKTFQDYSGAKLFYKKGTHDARYDASKVEQAAFAVTENAAMARGVSPAWASIGIVAFTYWIVWMCYFNMHGITTGFAGFALTLSTGFIFFGIPLAMGALFLIGYAIWHLTSTPERELRATRNNDKQLLLQLHSVEQLAESCKEKAGLTPYLDNLQGSSFDGNQNHPGLTRFNTILKLMEETKPGAVKQLLEHDFKVQDDIYFRTKMSVLYNHSQLEKVNLDKLYEKLIRKEALAAKQSSSSVNPDVYINKQIKKIHTAESRMRSFVSQSESKKSIDRLKNILGIKEDTARTLLKGPNGTKDINYDQAMIEAEVALLRKWEARDAALAKRQFISVCEKIIASTQALAGYGYEREYAKQLGKIVKFRIAAEHKIASYISRVLTGNMSAENLQLVITKAITQEYSTKLKKNEGETWKNAQDRVYAEVVKDYTQKLIDQFNQQDSASETEKLKTILGLSNDEISALSEANNAIFAELDKKNNAAEDKQKNFERLHNKWNANKKKYSESSFTRFFNRVWNSLPSLPVIDSKPGEYYKKAPGFIRRLREDRVGLGSILRGGIFGGFAGFMESGFAGWIITDFLFYICGITGALLTGLTISTPLIFGLVLGLTLLFTIYGAIKGNQKHKNTLRQLDELEEKLSTQEKIHNFVELENCIDHVKSLKVENNNLRSDIDLLLIEMCRKEDGTIDFVKFRGLRENYNPKIEFPDFTNDYFYQTMYTDPNQFGVVAAVLWHLSALIDGAGGGSFVGRFIIWPAMGCTIFALAVTNPMLAGIFIGVCVLMIAALKTWKMAHQRQREPDEARLNEINVRIKGLDEQESILLAHRQKLQEQFIRLTSKQVPVEREDEPPKDPNEEQLLMKHQQETSPYDKYQVPDNAGTPVPLTFSQQGAGNGGEQDYIQTPPSETTVAYVDISTLSTEQQTTVATALCKSLDIPAFDAQQEIPQQNHAYTGVTNLFASQQTIVAKRLAREVTEDLASFCEKIGLFKKPAVAIAKSCSAEQQEQQVNNTPVLDTATKCVI